jgi:hypothetical protein
MNVEYKTAAALEGKQQSAINTKVTVKLQGCGDEWQLLRTTWIRK